MAYHHQTAQQQAAQLSVTVSPLQSAYFAGETFTAQITFTNTAAPATAPSPPPPPTTSTSTSQHSRQSSRAGQPLSAAAAVPGRGPGAHQHHHSRTYSSRAAPPPSLPRQHSHSSLPASPTRLPPPPAPPPSSSSSSHLPPSTLASPQQLAAHQARTAHQQQRATRSASRRVRPPSASHISLADYGDRALSLDPDDDDEAALERGAPDAQRRRGGVKQHEHDADADATARYDAFQGSLAGINDATPAAHTAAYLSGRAPSASSSGPPLPPPPPPQHASSSRAALRSASATFPHVASSLSSSSTALAGPYATAAAAPPQASQSALGNASHSVPASAEDLLRPASPFYHYDAAGAGGAYAAPLLPARRGLVGTTSDAPSVVDQRPSSAAALFSASASSASAATTTGTAAHTRGKGSIALSASASNPELALAYHQPRARQPSVGLGLTDLHHHHHHGHDGNDAHGDDGGHNEAYRDFSLPVTPTNESAPTSSLVGTPSPRHNATSRSQQQQQRGGGGASHPPPAPSSVYNSNSNAGLYAGQNDTMESLVREGMDSWARHDSLQGSPARQPGPQAHHQHHHRKRSSYDYRDKSSALLFPHNSLLLFWCFAHLEGTFEIDEGLVRAQEFNELKVALAGGSGVVGAGHQTGAEAPLGVGGGTLEDGQGNAAGSAAGLGSWRDWILGRVAPTAGASDGMGDSVGDAGPSRVQGDRLGRGGGGGGGGASGGATSAAAKSDVRHSGATLEERRRNAMRGRAIPTFSSPPSILDVDMVLEPGQSRTFAFSLRIPADLPPSFRGKAIKFTYQLVVGTSRSTIGFATPRPGQRASLSRIMRVPVRMYNHVSVTGARPFYDLTNPVLYNRDEATISSEDDTPLKKSRRRRPSSGRADFERFAGSLLDSINSQAPNTPRDRSWLSPEPGPKLPLFLEAPPAQRPEMSTRTTSAMNPDNVMGRDEDEGDGCRGAVEIVTRNSPKSSFDINKDAYSVARLTLTKTAFRLGETINGSIQLNSTSGRVLRVSARLETHELIETTISRKSAAQVRTLTRRVHAEHHENTMDTARAGFALAIPSGATPDFATSGVKLQWTVRLTFLFVPPSSERPNDESVVVAQEGPAVPAGGHVRSGSVASAAGSARGGRATHGRTRSFAYGFEPSVPVSLPGTPVKQATGAAHLMPILNNNTAQADDLSSTKGTIATSSMASQISYRAVPDLGYVPVLYASTTSTSSSAGVAVAKTGGGGGKVVVEHAPGPLQRTFVGASHRATPSSAFARAPDPTVEASVVLVPAKVETVECAIPIRVYPGNTPFRPTVTVFMA